MKTKNIAGTLPENSRSSFADLQSQKNSKTGKKKCYILIKTLYKFLPPLLAALKKPSIRVTHTHLTLSI